VLTNQKSGTSALGVVLLAACMMWLSACSPPGPRALLRGRELVNQGRYPEAVPELEKAVALLPRAALAWNYLGLAYHGNGQPEQAAKAYRTALSLDHKLSVVRYNLGCLYLEQTNLVAAVDELRSYTLLQPGAVEGWLRLGSAQLHARRVDEAERSFRTALEVHPNDAEAVNGLGLVQLQRRHWAEAFAQFNVAASKEPAYPPAVLNAAIVAHQYLNNKPAALQRYRQYAALQPRPADADSVEGLARGLDRELAPPPVAAPAAPRPPAAPAPSPAPASLAATVPTHRTNAPSVPPAQNAAAQPRVAPSPLTTTPAPRTNTHTAAAVPPVRPGSVVSTPATNQTQAPTVANARPVAEPSRAPARPPVVPVPVTPAPAPVAKPAEPPPPRPAELEVAQVAPDLVVKPPQDLAPPPDGAGEAQGSALRSDTASSTNQAKRGLLARFLPFSPKSRPPANSPTEGQDARPVEVASRMAPAPDIGPPRPIPRYNYLSPAPPTAGNRVEAEKEFKKALKSSRNGNRAQAIGEYQAAVRTDPAYYDGYYNLGLAALENSDVRLSLWAYEIALALKPEAEDARYNFALALKAGGYYADAVEELNRIATAHPSDFRPHLSLGNLYAQQLRQPQLARPHYERVLELNPSHPESTRIRLWLGSNQ
jgi:tetratricopeptide (TPR) repeat protein